MLGLSYGEIFLLLGATAALIGPKDLPMISRTAGRLAGRAIGYVQLARGQFDTVMQQSQARQVHKELQDTMAQLDAIRHEIRSISLVNPGPLTRRLDNLDQTSMANDNKKPEDAGVNNSISSANKDSTSLSSNSCNMQSQATTYSRLVESSAIKNGLLANSTKVEQNKDELQPTEDSTSLSSNLCNMQSQATTYARLAKSPGLKNSLLADSTEVEKKIDELQVTVLPVSAENAGLLPNHDAADVKGSDIVLEAILEAEVANNAKEFFSHPQNQI